MRRSLRRAVVAAVAALAFAWSPSLALAGDHYSGDDVALADAAMPEGWTLVGAAEATAEQTALKDAVVAAARGSGAADSLLFVMRTVKAKGGETAVVALVDADQKSSEVLTMLKGAAEAKGWAVRDLGDPAVILVVSAPAEVRAKVVEVQVAYAVKMLAMKASMAIENGNGSRAEALAKRILTLDPKNAPANRALGIFIGGLGVRNKENARIDKGVEHLRAALAKDATEPLSAKERTDTLALIANFLIQKPGANPDARDALKEALAAASDDDVQAKAGLQYNLACAHARLGELDEAFKHLTAVLERHLKDPIEGISHWKDGDPDFDNLKADPRWAELVKKYGATASTPPKEE